MREVPEGFFEDIVSSNNFLTITLNDLFANIANSDASEGLKSKAKRFSEHLTKKFNWDFTEELEDCAPVVVDADGNY